jgi:hypothetical protein
MGVRNAPSSTGAFSGLDCGGPDVRPALASHRFASGLSERSATKSDSEDDSDEAEVVETCAAPKVDSNQLSDPMATAETDYLYGDGDGDSVATVDAGCNHLVQQKLSGKHRAHQFRYDIRLHVAPSEEADKTMIAAAKSFFSKAKEMDKSLVIYPWFKNSINPNIKNVRSIPEQMGAFKTVLSPSSAESRRWLPIHARLARP